LILSFPPIIAQKRLRAKVSLGKAQGMGQRAHRIQRWVLASRLEEVRRLGRQEARELMVRRIVEGDNESQIFSISHLYTSLLCLILITFTAFSFSSIS